MPVMRLIRHAQATYGSERDAGLTELGLRQAEALDAALAQRHAPPARAAVGTLRRQADTARACRRSLTAAPSVTARWDEYLAVDVLEHHGDPAAQAGPGNSLGAPAAMSAREFQAVLDGALTAWIAAGERSPCAESWPAFQRRALGAVHELGATLGGGEEAWVFTSGGVIAAIGAGLLEAPPAVFLALNRVSVNSSVTTVMIGGGGTRLLTFNDHSHLEHDRVLTTFR